MGVGNSGVDSLVNAGGKIIREPTEVYPAMNYTRPGSHSLTTNGGTLSPELGPVELFPCGVEAPQTSPPRDLK